MKYQDKISEFKERTSNAKNDFLQCIKKPLKTQTSVLKDLCEITKNAKYWRDNKADLKNILSLKKTVPISSYQKYENAIKNEIIAKGGVLSNSQVFRWLKTSGTTGKSKLIPYTWHWMRKYRVPAMYAMWDTFIKASPQILCHEYAILDTQTVRDATPPSVYGLPEQSISNRYPQIDESDWNPPWNDALWYSPEMPSEHSERSYMRLRHFIGKDLRGISAINPSMILSLRDKLSDSLEELLDDLKNGTIHGERSQFFTPDPHSASHLYSLLNKSNIILKDIWPKLNFISCWTSAGAANYYSKIIEQAPHATVVPFMTCGTEGAVTIPICPSIDSQPLAINQAVFEFIPEEISPDTWLNTCKIDTLGPSELLPDRRYHMIMSQAHGLLRLWTGDIFEVQDVQNGTPWLRFIERYGVFNSFTGEKLTHTDLAVAFNCTFKKLRLDNMPYLISPKWDNPPYYIAIVESEQRIKPATFSAQLDQELCEINLEYQSKRQSKRLEQPIIKFCPPDTLRKEFEKQRIGQNSNQHKFKHHQADSSIVENLIKEYKYYAEV